MFVNGRQCVTMRVYPGRTDSVGVSLRAQGAEAGLLALEAWQMKSIYEHDSSGAPAICLRRKHQH